jgi:hypothetical protein
MACEPKCEDSGAYKIFGCPPEKISKSYNGKFPYGFKHSQCLECLREEIAAQSEPTSDDVLTCYELMKMKAKK